MKVILSRKGFDSKAGGLCNPILPDGTLLSLPIPGDSTYQVKYSDLSYLVSDGKDNIQLMRYEDILNQLSGNQGWQGKETCHLDPDLREDIITRNGTWYPAFGQDKKARKFLEDNEVGEGDLFLFFGRFKQTEFDENGELRYIKGSPEQHIIYAYMEVGKVLKDDEIDTEFPWHPHAHRNNNDNNLYIPSKCLSMNPDKPGFGLLNYSFHRVLTKYGMSVSKWKLPDFFRGLNMRVETKNGALLENFIDMEDGENCFQFIGYGQEFLLKVYEQDKYAKFYQKSLEEWAYKMIIDEAYDECMLNLRKEKLEMNFRKYIRLQEDVKSVLVIDEMLNETKQYMEERIYCRYYHRIMAFNTSRCENCCLYMGTAQGMGVDCKYDAPVFEDIGLYIPITPRDRYAFYEILTQRGIVKRQDYSWDGMI